MLGYIVNKEKLRYFILENKRFKTRHRIDGRARFHTNKAATMQRHNDFYYFQNCYLLKREILQEMQEKEIRLAYKDII